MRNLTIAALLAMWAPACKGPTIERQKEVRRHVMEEISERGLPETTVDQVSAVATTDLLVRAHDEVVRAFPGVTNYDEFLRYMELWLRTYVVLHTGGERL